MVDNAAKSVLRGDPIAVEGVVNVSHPARELRQWRKDSETWIKAYLQEMDDLAGEIAFHKGQIARINDELDRRGLSR